MLKKTGMALGAAMLAVVGFNAEAGIKQGDLEVGASMQIISSDAFDFTFIQANGGYMYTDAIQAKLAVSANESGGTMSGTLSPGVDYHFGAPGSDMVPFVGLAYGLNIGDDDTTDFFDFHAGLKQFVNDRTSIQYGITLLEATDSDVDASMTIMSIGLNFYF